MTLDEKIGQMTQVAHDALRSPADIATYHVGALLSGGGGGPNGAGGTASQWADMYDRYQSYAMRARLRIPLLYGVDAVHGNGDVYGAVVFPQNIGMGATRDPALVTREEEVTRDEVLGTGVPWTFAPCVCVPRDKRWGRTYEGFGEDTALVQSMTAAAVRGFQGPALGRSSVMATAKHFVADGGTTYGTGDRGYRIDEGDARITEAELDGVHLAPFQTAVAAGVGAVMVSYSSWNGLKDHADPYLITAVLKGRLGFGGLVVSDWGGIDQISPNYDTRVRTAIEAGIDMVMLSGDYRRFIGTVRREVTAGKIPESRINDAVTRILNAKFALGLFAHPYADRAYTAQVGSAAHRAVARQAVRESLVLLKNQGVLPLSRTAHYRIVVGGRSADNLGYQMGGWSITWQGGSGRTTAGTTIWQGLRAAAGPSVQMQDIGTDLSRPFTGDVGIAVVGETPYAEGSGDTATMALAPGDAAVVKAICSHTKQCVVILVSGRPLIVGRQLAESSAFVAAWLPGSEGEGVADVLFGEHPFTGRLPVSWPAAVGQEPLDSGDGQTPLFPFGYGISPY
ncbi:MAG TPA: glycoside hydrolase family 3 N-terminal domain-containing protein [Candidatus Dormibacteraeota bacterium]|nr:glycoside hydrolase family 3 N-terminal domain-containing protein [Candidatus Dormibacteraeota bacterium]